MNAPSSLAILLVFHLTLTYTMPLVSGRHFGLRHDPDAMPEPFRAFVRHARPPFVSTSLEGLEQVIPLGQHSIEAFAARKQLDKPLPEIPSGISSGDSSKNGAFEIVERSMCSGLANVSRTTPSSVVVHGNHSHISPNCFAMCPPCSFCINGHERPSSGAPRPA